MSVRFPFYARKMVPVVGLVQSDEISMRTFTEISGGADSYIVFPEAHSQAQKKNYLKWMMEQFLTKTLFMSRIKMLKILYLNCFPELSGSFWNLNEVEEFGREKLRLCLCVADELKSQFNRWSCTIGT